MPPDHDRIVMIKSEYAVVGEVYQRKAEEAIAGLSKSSSNNVTASDVFNALASVLDSDRTTNANPEIHGLIVEYVAEVATLWRQVGLRPSRATRQENSGYRSRFHRFVDLVLTAMTEPWMQRHVKVLTISADKSGLFTSNCPMRLVRLSALPPGEETSIGSSAMIM